MKYTSQYVVRYKLDNDDTVRLVIVDARNIGECKTKALNWIYRMHNIRDVNDQYKVVLDLFNNL